MIAVIGAHLQHLIANGTDLNGSVKALDQFHHERMLCYGVSVCNTAGSQEHGIDEVLVCMRSIPVGLTRMEIEVNLWGQLEQLLDKRTQGGTQLFSAHQVEANE